MRGHVRQRSKGSWQILWDLPRAADGKRQAGSETLRGTKKQAEARLIEILRSLDTGAYVDPSKLTLGGYLQQWLEHAQSTVSGSTWRSYEVYVRRHLVPGLGRLPLAQVTPVVVEQFYGRLAKQEGFGGRGVLSARSRHHAHVILRTALERAVKLRLIARNPCDAVDPPRVPWQEQHPLSPEQVTLLLSAIRGTPLFGAVLLAIATGCRRGELCGLRWSDVDLDAPRIVIQRAVEVTKEGIKLKEPKTAGSRRAVPLPAFAVEELRRLKAGQAERRLLLGPAYQGGDYVLCWEDGRPLRPDYVTGAFRKAARRLCLPTSRFHDLRHSFATLLLVEKVHPRVVSGLLGHSTVSTTLNIYSHLLPGLGEEAAGKLDAAMRRASSG